MHKSADSGPAFLQELRKEISTGIKEKRSRKNHCFYSSFFIIGQSFFKSAFLLFDDAAQAAQLPEQPIHLPFLRRLTIKTVAAATAAAKMQIITMSAVFIQKGLRRCKL
jgi:hypothetical protein